MTPWLVPNAHEARVAREKITDYLLSSSHTYGRSKAEFFVGFGFRTEEWRVLAEALVGHCVRQSVVEVEETAYGVKYAVSGPLQTPDGRSPIVRTIWQVDAGSEFPRLISARPGQ